MEKFKGLLRVCKGKAARIFPERQIYFRTDGNVRFIKISTFQQFMATASAVALFGSVTVVSVTSVVRHFELSQRERRIEAMEGDITQVASRIESRQQLLLELLNRRLQPTTGRVETADAGAAAQAAAVAEAALAIGPGMSDGSSELQRYRSYERQQLALIQSASLAAETRIKETEAVLKRLGLNSRRLVGQSPANLKPTALGGPFIEANLADKHGKSFSGPFEAPFRNLLASWNRLDSLERASLSIPAIVPVKSFHHSSGYGYRHDPFTGGGAFHTGVDLAGRHGEPVMAAAGGVVTRAAYWGAYGRMVEIDHGRGLVTRYGHLSAIKARAGERVEPGAVVGLMGSSGRSTGTHLHYEVRYEDRALNPLPFLRAADDLLAIQKRAQEAQG